MSDALTAHAAERAAAWGALAGTPRLVAERENAVFAVTFADGMRAALRLHRDGYQNADAIRAELTWAEALAAKGFACPKPLRTQDGALLTEARDARAASMVTWLDATHIAGTDLSGARGQRIFHALGALLGSLHALTDAGASCDRALRPAWDLDGLTGPDPFWGRYWENPSLSPEEAGQLARARDTARAWLLGLEAPDTGLIHADAIGENVLGDADSLWLIDFDDCGTGYRLYDLGVPLVQHWDLPNLADLADALIEGYGGTRGITPTRDDILRFMTLRALASAGWIVPRADPGDPRQRHYAQRALTCAKRYLDVG